MYDEIVKSVDLTAVDLTADEVDIIKELLSYRLDHCISIGEEYTVRDLLDKLK